MFTLNNTIKTKEDARSLAIQWQNWVSEQNFVTHGAMFEYENFFRNLGEQFDLTEEFKENGII